jgi:methionine-S-sulfoxide reductase
MKREVIILAGGCFWGMEDIIRKIPGVLDTEVGYCGGHTDHPTYSQVCTGQTGHAESLRVEFDPQTLSLENLLKEYFFKMHDPTTLNRQGNDVGTQYRSAIFCQNEDQVIIANKVKAEVEKLNWWGKPLLTEVLIKTNFYSAEEVHQDYLEKHPNGYTCHYLRSF